MQHVHRDQNAIKVHINVCYIWDGGMKFSYFPFTAHCKQSFFFSLFPERSCISRLWLLILIIQKKTSQIQKYLKSCAQLTYSNIILSYSVIP